MCHVQNSRSSLEAEVALPRVPDQPCHFESLPADVLLNHVIPLLGLSSRVTLASTSRGFAALLFSDVRLWESLDFSSNARVDDETVLRVTKKLSKGRLSSLDVTGCSVLPSTLVEVASCNSQLEVLRGSTSTMWTKAQVFQARGPSCLWRERMEVGLTVASLPQL